jgi:hypothetical protein
MGLLLFFLEVGELGLTLNHDPPDLHCPSTHHFKKQKYISLISFKAL